MPPSRSLDSQIVLIRLDARHLFALLTILGCFVQAAQEEGRFARALLSECSTPEARQAVSNSLLFFTTGLVEVVRKGKDDTMELVDEDMDLIADLKETFDQAVEDLKSGKKPKKPAPAKSEGLGEGAGGPSGAGGGRERPRKAVVKSRSKGKSKQGGGGGAAAPSSAEKKKQKKGRERGLTEAEMLEAAIAASLQES
jgi:hypothetical protein